MEKIKQSLPAKTVAFILLIIVMTMTVLSVMIIILNVEKEWYYNNQNKENSLIYHEVATDAFGEIMDSYWMEHDPEMEADWDTSELYNMQWTEFGYKIYKKGTKAKGNKLLKEVNKELKSQASYTETFNHGDEFSVAIYLGEMREGEMPPNLLISYNQYKMAYEFKVAAVWVAIAGLILIISLYVFLVAAVGCGNKEKNQNSELRKVPLDLLAIGGILAIYMFGLLVTNNLSGYTFSEILWGVILLTIWITMVGTSYILLFAKRAKLGRWWQSTSIHGIFRCLRALCRELSKIPLVPKTTAIVVVTFIINFILVVGGSDYLNETVLFAIIIWILVCVFVLYIAIGLAKLKEAGIRLAEGDLSYRVDKNGLRWGLADHADSLNNISRGMSKAVEEKMKSERFKAELITNVSHDIKTPLTSIISYVDFLKKEDLDNEKAREYIEVLDRQSQRLKKLTEDLVEASKAATGNVQMELAPCEVGILMTQTVGEYEEKAKSNELNFVVRVPEKELEIMADGKRLWRVFDNLLNNICKYSQPGTRVYLTLEEADGEAIVTYKNTSKYELNITGDELMERFIRGDRSRHTEGSGLGLSIARNLVELQGGTLDITVDGDLFKVVIKFQLV